MKRASIAGAALAALLFLVQPGYSQYASFTGVNNFGPGVGYSSTTYSSYGSGPMPSSYYGSFVNNYGVPSAPGTSIVAPQVIMMNQGYGSYIAGSGYGGSSSASVLYFPAYQPYIPSSFLGIEYFLPRAVYTPYNPY